MVPIYATEAWWWAARPLWVLLWSGVFDRHPDLRLAITEDGAWWLADIVERMDEKWVGGHNTRKFGNLFRESIERKPSEYLGTNVFLGASTPSRHEIVDPRADRRAARCCGATTSPTPRARGPTPASRSTTCSTTCPSTRRPQMLGLTAAEVYRFDIDKLAGTAERIGPTHEEVHG